MNLYSPSEEFGLSLLRGTDCSVLSIGISTAGASEIRMAQKESGRHIIATTIDKTGAEQTIKTIASAGFSDQIEVRVEDIASSELPYEAESFDFVYARLVLHYLTRQQLEIAIKNVSRIIRKTGVFYIVVRSTQCIEAKDPSSVFDPETCLTTYKTIDYPHATAQRYFHSDGSISDVLQRHGFVVQSISHVSEALAPGFERDKLASHKDDLIQISASKSDV
ncbi:methyltransferase domain-containing protein [Candidatus Saccharibacteria bacterium]|nr:MAG: methyltransferase domain-containing protein [Candidatus Saccharibacteria bacterium]